MDELKTRLLETAKRVRKIAHDYEKEAQRIYETTFDGWTKPLDRASAHYKAAVRLERKARGDETRLRGSNSYPSSYQKRG